MSAFLVSPSSLFFQSLRHRPTVSSLPSSSADLGAAHSSVPGVHDDRGIPAEELNFTGLTLTQPMEFSSQSWGYTEAFQSQHKAPLLTVQARPSPGRYKRKARWTQSNCSPIPGLVLAHKSWAPGRMCTADTRFMKHQWILELLFPTSGPLHMHPPCPETLLSNTNPSLGSHLKCRFPQGAIYGRHCSLFSRHLPAPPLVIERQSLICTHGHLGHDIIS